MGDNTTNRMEGTFSVFKSHLKDRCCSNPSPKEVLPILCEKADEMNTGVHRDVMSQKRFEPLLPEYPEFQAQLRECSFAIRPLAARIFRDNLKLMKSMKTTSISVGQVKEVSGKNVYAFKATTTHCNCNKYKNFLVPCKHILAIRQHEGLDIYSKELFIKKHHRPSKKNDDTASQQPVSVEEDSQSTVFSDVPLTLPPQEVLSPRTKFKQALALANAWAQDVCQHGTKVFESYLAVQRKFNSAVKNSDVVELIKKQPVTSEVDKDVDKEVVREVDKEQYNTKFNFRRGVSTRGRPKRSSSQVTFNKKAAVKTTPSEAEIASYFLAKGFKIVNVKGDGNCLFRAIALLLEKDQNRYQKYRDQTSQFMAKNKEKLLPWFSTTENEVATYDDLGIFSFY